jgi:hypothetical protein
VPTSTAVAPHNCDVFRLPISIVRAPVAVKNSVVVGSGVVQWSAPRPDPRAPLSGLVSKADLA